MTSSPIQETIDAALLATDLVVPRLDPDPLDAVDVLEETIAQLLPAADLQWEVRGESVVLLAHVGASHLEVCPLGGGRVRITTVVPPASGEPVEGDLGQDALD